MVETWKYPEAREKAKVDIKAMGGCTVSAILGAVSSERGAIERGNGFGMFGINRDNHMKFAAAYEHCAREELTALLARGEVRE